MKPLGFIGSLIALTIVVSPLAAGAPASAHSHSRTSSSRAATRFIAQCEEYFAASPRDLPRCRQLARTKPVASLKALTRELAKTNALVRDTAPKMAKLIQQACVANALGTKDLAILEMCLRIHRETGNLERVARGHGTPARLRKVMDSVATNKNVVYPTENTEDAERQRSQIREAAVHECIAQAGDLVQVVCSAVAVHEAFRKNPYGPNGELAKAFDKVAQAYGYATLPQAVIRETARKALSDANVNDQVIRAIFDPVTGATEGAKHAQEEADKGLDHLRNSIRIEGVPQIKLW